MIEYIYRDLAQATRYLPYGLATGIPVGVLALWLINRSRKKRQRVPVSWLPFMIFCIYLAVMLAITFLSRESGSRNGMDLELFSTWGINKRNNAFVIENVLLFVPFGFLCSWNFDKAKKLWRCALIGGAVSLGIECLQLMTGRGFFQIDDILTNILGTIIGCLVFKAGYALCRRR